MELKLSDRDVTVSHKLPWQLLQSSPFLKHIAHKPCWTVKLGILNEYLHDLITKVNTPSESASAVIKNYDWPIS